VFVASHFNTIAVCGGQKAHNSAQLWCAVVSVAGGSVVEWLGH